MISNNDIEHAKILIVDDLPVNIELLDYLLTNSGYANVSSPTDPRAVAELHRAHRYDLIILDLHMPGMSGFEVMEARKPLETGAWLPVLVVTADPDKMVAALAAGARDFVGKPFDPVEVLTRIRNLLEVRLLHRESARHGALLEKTVRERTFELQRFRSAMDASADAVFLIDAADMSIADVSDGACRMLGYSRADLPGGAIAQAIISMAHGLQMEVIAEGVESTAQRNYPGRQRCDEIQGFHFSRPLPAGEVARMVLENRTR